MIKPRKTTQSIQASNLHLKIIFSTISILQDQVAQKLLLGHHDHGNGAEPQGWSGGVGSAT